VADRIRIKKSYVTAMEQGQFDALPSPFYARSYLRTYAHFLGLDASAILREYREQTMEQEAFDRPFSRGWEDRGPRRSPSRDEDGYRQWPLSERTKDREPSSLRRRRRLENWDGETPPYGTGRSEAVPYRSTLSNGKSQAWEDPSREGAYDPDAFSADPDPYHSPVDPSPSHQVTSPRSLSMPKDVPSPREIGISMRSNDATGPHALPTVGNARSEQPDVVPHLSRRRRTTPKEKEGTFGKWYNRFLIAGTVLLIPAALAVGILIWGEEKQPINAGDRTEVSADGNSEESKKEPIVYPVETSNKGPDHFELTQVDKIELKIEAEGDCRVEVREQEVGKKLKEVTLKSGSAPFAYESDKEDLWVEVEPSKNVKISVNGKNIGEYKKQKVVHIRLVK